MQSSPHFTTLVRRFDPEVLADVYARNAAPQSFAFGLPDAELLSQLQESDHARVVLAEYSKTIIGAAILTFPAMPAEKRIIPWFSREDLAVLSRIVVEHEMRGMGVATQILRCAETTAARMGATDLGCPIMGSSGDFLGPLGRRGFKPAAKFSHEEHKVVALRKSLTGGAAQAA